MFMLEDYFRSLNIKLKSIDLKYLVSFDCCVDVSNKFLHFLFIYFKQLKLNLTSWDFLLFNFSLFRQYKMQSTKSDNKVF
jgi:hypothetical protein